MRRRRGLVHQVSFNYRFIPAVRLAREMIQAGELGAIVHFRMRYTDDSLSDPKTPHTWRQEGRRAGSGVIGDLAFHALDLGRFSSGSIGASAGCPGSWCRDAPSRRARATQGRGRRGLLRRRGGVAGGAPGTLEASACCPGQKNYLTVEANGTRGSLWFNLERLTKLEVFKTEVKERRDRGSRTVLTDQDHPYGGRGGRRGTSWGGSTPSSITRITWSRRSSGPAR